MRCRNRGRGDGGERGERRERRERACANRLMDMIEKDLRTCLPALSMFTNGSKRHAFEAFLDDMERRFARGTLPKRMVG